MRTGRFLLLPLLAAGCQPPPVPPEGARPVVVVRAKSRPLIEEESYTGVVKARYETDMAFRITGKVVRRLVDVGAKVKAGQVLAELDKTDEETSVKAAQADLSAAQIDFRQAEREEQRRAGLLSQGAVGKSEYDQAKATADSSREKVQKAERTIELARNRLTYCTLRAEYDGIIVATAAEDGQVVGDGKMVLRHARTSEVEAVVGVPEDKVPLLTASKATASLWSAPGQSCAATLREVSPSADPATRTYEARYRMVSPAARVELGMTVTVHLLADDSPTGVVLPLSALGQLDGKPIVWVVDASSQKPQARPVEVLGYRQTYVALRSGVADGELVVRAGVQKLDPNVVVRVVLEEK